MTIKLKFATMIAHYTGECKKRYDLLFTEQEKTELMRKIEPIFITKTVFARLYAECKTTPLSLWLRLLKPSTQCWNLLKTAGAHAHFQIN